MKSSSVLAKKKLLRKRKVKVKKNSFTVVAIGASAGGLEAMSTLLKNLPADTGMAYIFVQHLSPTYKSFLTTILARITKMKVQEIDDMELMKPNNVYVIPSNKGIEVTDGHIKLLPRSKRIPPISIDVLFASLAETHQENVIGIILSGNASDGTRGMKAIKAAGGVTIAQDDSAQVPSMPQSAIDSGAVDFVLSPKEISRELIRMSIEGLGGSNGKTRVNGDVMRIDEDAELKIIFDHLHEKAGVDFSHYKITTINRRLNHRMLQLGIKTRKEYSNLVVKEKKESDLLYKDLLIHVTGFFRDTTTYQYLKSTFLPKLLKSKSSGETLRIWVVACSTGEEAFSIAMLISELQQTKKKKIAVKIFATDLSEQVIHEARIGKYSSDDVKGVSKQRLERFFTKIGDEYLISKELREMCVFAPHNVLSDPPFFRMDFISCRNLLIYFDVAAQKKALGLLHFALNEGSYLMLGKAETIGVMPQLFTQLNSKFKIYSSKKHLGIRRIPQLVPRFSKALDTKKNPIAVLRKPTTFTSSELDKAIDSVLLAQHMPACAIINRDMEILQFRGLTSLYLSHPSGRASLNILKMVRPEFAFELRGAVNKALKTKKTVLKSDIEMKINNSFQMISLEVSPLKIEWDEPLLLIVFTLQDKVVSHTDKKGKSNTTRKDLRIKNLTEELSMVRTEMHSLIESQENAYAELQAANEEIVSTNEEFQTLNEELETSKEEIEATNEELIATNQELKTHNELLAESYNYSQTIIATIHEPMLILDSNLIVKSANKSFYKKFQVTKEDTENMHLFELGNEQWNIPTLRKLLGTLLSKNTDFENFEMTHTFPGLGEKIMLLNASRIFQKTHREKLILLAIEDITERTRYHLKEKELLKKDIKSQEAANVELEKAVRIRTKELLEKNVELETANKDLTSFTYITSHDLQEPLRKIQNFIGLIHGNKNKNATGDSAVYLQRIGETATRMRKLIDALLAYSRTKKGERHFEKRDLNVLLNEVKNQLQEEIEKKKAVIIADNLGEANVIPFQICQLLDNLVCNSLKFSKPEVPPHIVIKRKIVPGRSLKNLKLPSKENFIHIRYTDNGIGFESKYNERIFEVFQRLHSYESYKGTGIGLAICKRIVENHNGMITASGKKDKGATFDIYIPVA